MTEIQYIGDLNAKLLSAHFGQLRTSKVVLTSERLSHINQKHAADIPWLQQYANSILAAPDYILLDNKNDGTILMIKHLQTTNLNLVVRLALATDELNKQNSVMTFFRLRDKNLQRLLKLQKTLYKAE